jgi:dienelactone hydrolase
MSSSGAPMTLDTPEGRIAVRLHAAEQPHGGGVMVGGAGGGMHGPSNIYAELAEQVRAEGITTLRIDYRAPNDLAACVYDTLAAVAALVQMQIPRIVLVGWSFGGAVVITAGAQTERVVGVATVASQTHGTGAVSQLAPRSLLLIHGTGDSVLPDRCSRDLYARAGEPKEIVLYPGDDHGITHHRSELLEALSHWTTRVLADPGDASDRETNATL